MRTTPLLLAAVLLSACSSKVDDKPKAEVKEAKDVPADVAAASTGGPKLDAANSKLGFVGAKVTDDHEGNFSDFTATLALDGDTPKSLSIKVKTESVQIEPDKLREHLMSPDFFDTAKYPG